MSVARRVANAIARRVRAMRISRWPAAGSWRRTPDGFWMFLKPGAFLDPIYAYSVLDPAFRAIVPRIVQPGDVVLDVGGEKGWYALVFARAVGSAGHVVTIEPDPAAADTLQANLARNGVTNVTLVRAAVGDAARSVPFKLNEVVGWSSLTPNAHQAASVRSVVEVPMRTLEDIVDAVCPPGARVAMMKLDVEGAEVTALRGALRILDDHRPVLWLEINPASLAAAGSAALQLGAVLQPRGYQFWRVRGEYRAFGRTRVWFEAISSLASVCEEMDVVGIPPALFPEWAPILNAAPTEKRPLR